MELNTDAFFAFWNAEPIETHEATKKLSYRVIGGFKFQFRKMDYRRQTQLGFRVGAQAKKLEPLFVASQSFIDPGEDATQPQRDAADEHNTALMMKALPELLGFIGDPDVEALLHDLVVTVSVDRGEGTFEPLSSEIVAEAIFGDDISLQLPVAATVLEVNLAGFIRRVVGGFGSTK